MAVVIEPTGLEFASADSELRATTLAMPDGGFAVVWATPAGIGLKIFDTTGDLEYYAEIEAPTTTPVTDWYNPTATLLKDGKIALSWVSDSGTLSLGDTDHRPEFAVTNTPGTPRCA